MKFDQIDPNHHKRKSTILIRELRPFAKEYTEGRFLCNVKKRAVLVLYKNRPQAVEKVFSQQPFLSLSEFLPVKTAKKEK